MRDLIDREKLLSIYTGNVLTAQTDYAEGLRDVISDIRSAPTVDAVEVVRCKDCRYATMTADGKFAKTCAMWTDEYYFVADHFCAEGERKEVSE